MEERKKPTRPFSVIYADAKQALTRQVGNTMAAYGLPIFMAEGILSGILAEIRTNAGNELADDTARYEEELKEYYEAQTKEMQETFEKEKADLIQAFENPVDPEDPGETPSAEPDPEDPGETPSAEPDPEPQTTEEKQCIEEETEIEEVD